MNSPPSNIGGLFFCLFLSSLIGGCATLSSSLDRRAGAEAITQKAGFTRSLVSTDRFKLTAYSRISKQGQPLTIYIEGDGLAWLSKRRLSRDPTPRHPLVLRLATMDTAPNVAYLARPCQYTPISTDSSCSDSAYWSDKRFSEEVIASMNEAVDQLKASSGAPTVRMAGYSGGGAVAVLITARRNDVSFLSTIAGNLDHEAVNRLHHVSLMPESLNPIDFAASVSHVPQKHFVGGKDKVVPASIAAKFIQKAGSPPTMQIVDIPEATHTSGWDPIEPW